MSAASLEPLPIDTSGVELPPELHELAEALAENTYDLRSRQRALNGSGKTRKGSRKTRNDRRLFSYEELAENEKQDDRNIAIETLRLILKLGYRLEPPAAPLSEDPRAQSAPSPARLVDKIDSLNLASLITLWHGRTPDEWADVPELHRYAGRRVLKLGEPLLAYDILREGLEHLPGDVQLRQLLALALARSGATLRSNWILTQLRAEGHCDEETLGILARTHKDLWTQAETEAERRRQLRLAHKFYSEAYKLNRGYYSGVNAATLALLLAKKNEARALAQEVRQACLKELKAQKENHGDPYWLLATLGEAALILRRWSEAQAWYAEAAEIARERFADLSSTRRNARLILDHFRRDSKEIERCFRIPSVAVFAGHLIDRPNRHTARFPPQLEPAVRAAIRTRLKKLDAGFGYASAGCGSDILFLEELLETGGEANIVLPYDKKQFVKDSVEILPDTDWAARFEQVLARAGSVVTASNQRLDEGSISFEYANLLLHGLAQIRARQLETELVPLAVWDLKKGDGPGGTASAVEHWRSLGLDVEMIDLGRMLRRERPELTSKKTGASPVKPKHRKKSSKQATRIMAMLFADAVNFSKLTEPQIPRFLNHFLGAIGKLLAKSSHAPLIKNTWGDGLYFVFSNVREAGLFALELCDLMVDTEWSAKGLPKAINLRIALHAGPVYSCIDPVTGQPTYTGTHVSRAARIEPITPPGQVYASQAFAALAAAHGLSEFTCDYVGQTPLAKGYGTFATYHVRRSNANASA